VTSSRDTPHAGAGGSEPRGLSVRRLVDFGDRHQVGLYLLALAAGALVGLTAPGSSPSLERAIEPVLAVLLYATFLQVPFTGLAAAFRDGRFLAAVLTINFVIVPLVVLALTRVLPDGRAVLLGVLLVLLTPCIDSSSCSPASPEAPRSACWPPRPC
jgi:ACR3 family arsenite transporter